MTIIKTAIPLTGLLDDKQITADTELQIVVLNSADMTELNETYLGHEGDTDVITFDFRESEMEWDGECIGEIYVCLDFAIRYSKESGFSLSKELILYIVHGILHMAGYDDLDPENRQEMRKAESFVLGELEKKFNLDDLL